MILIVVDIVVCCPGLSLEQLLCALLVESPNL